MKMLLPEQERRVAGASDKYRGVVRRAYAGAASPRTAIKAFCLQCVGYMREDVARCTALACPLHGYRPYQRGEGDGGE